MGVEILKKGGKANNLTTDVSTKDIVDAVLKKIDLSDIKIDEDKIKESILASIDIPQVDIDGIKADIKKEVVTKEELDAVKTTITNQAKAINRIDADLDVLGGTDE